MSCATTIYSTTFNLMDQIQIKDYCFLPTGYTPQFFFAELEKNCILHIYIMKHEYSLSHRPLMTFKPLILFQFYLRTGTSHIHKLQ